MGEPASSSSHQDNSKASPGNNEWVLPKQLEDIQAARDFPQYRHRWNTNEEIASILIAFSKHKEWLKMEMKVRPPSGSMLLYSRNRVRYRKDGYCWKKRKDGKNIREDHMKLKVQGLECIYGSYVHSDILPTFHRRCYWLLQNPDIVLVHYLNIPYQDNTKVKIPVVPPYTLEKKEWTKEELVDQLRPMFSTGQPGEESEQMIDETVEALVKHLIEYHENANKFVKDKRPVASGNKHSRDPPPHIKKSLHPQHLHNKKHTGNPGEGSSHVIHHKPDVTQVPYLLNVGGKLNVPVSSYLLVNGHGGSENGHSSQGLVVHEGGGGLQLTGADGSTLVPCPSASGAASQSEGTHLDYQSVQNLHNACSMSDICDSHDKLVSCSLEQPLLNTCKQDFTPMQFSSDNCSSLLSSTNMIKSEVNLVPYLKSVTVEDVQHVIRSHTEDSKGKAKGFPSELEQDPLSASFGSSDFDNLDLHEIEKLCSFLETPEDRSTQEMAGSSPVPQANSKSSTLDQFTEFKSTEKVTTSCQQCQQKSRQPASEHKTVSRKSSGRGLVDIVDYSPECSYTEGGTKLLLIGPWTKVSSTYTCVIDGEPVQTSLLQPGVLRCYTPAHDKGCVPVYVSCDGKTLSRPVPFLYKENPENKPSSRFSWFSVKDKELKSLLVERLVQLENRLTQSHYRDGPVPSLQQASQDLVESDDMEGKLLWYIKMFSAGTWSDTESFPHCSKYGMTLLHLTAALGYSRVIQSLLQWRTDNPCWFLDYEVDANCLDENSCTALMWACAKGHQQAAIVLYQWNSETLKVTTKDGFSALNFAQMYGHHQVYSELNKYQTSLTGLPHTAGSVDTAFPLPPQSQPHRDIFKQPHPRDMSSLHIQIPNPAQQQPGFLTRRQSEQDLRGKSTRKKLSKRASVDLPANSEDGRSARAGSYEYPIRETNSEPYLPMATDHPMTRGENPMLSDNRRDIMSPDLMMNSEMDQLKQVNLKNLEPSSLAILQTSSGYTKMDTDEVESSASGSPIIDVERVSSDEESYYQHTRSKSQSISSDSCEDVKHQMVTLAKQIIAAMPERIKLSPSRCDEGEPERERSGSYSSLQSQTSPHASSYEEDSGISTPMGDTFTFDDYRYTDLGTPASSLSPDSTCMPSPYSPYSFTLDSPPPTTEDFTEYFNAPTTFMEKDFSQLTLSDKEQRKLYEAAKVIQKTYRQYRDKQQLQQQQQKEIEAAVLIQKYYRRYKQYAYYKKMTQAAVLIQSQFRSYYAQKRFKKSRDAAVVIQNQYRTYKEHERLKKGGNKSVIIQQRYRSHYRRKNVKGQSTEEHVIPVVPDSAESSPPDQSNTVSDISKQPDDERTSGGRNGQQEEGNQSSGR